MVNPNVGQTTVVSSSTVQKSDVQHRVSQSVHNNGWFVASQTFIYKEQHKDNFVFFFHIAQYLTSCKSSASPPPVLQVLRKTKHTLHPFIWWVTIPLITITEKLAFYINISVNSTLNVTSLVLVLRTGPKQVLSEAFFLLPYKTNTIQIIFMHKLEPKCENLLTPSATKHVCEVSGVRWRQYWTVEGNRLVLTIIRGISAFISWLLKSFSPFELTFYLLRLDSNKVLTFFIL